MGFKEDRQQLRNSVSIPKYFSEVIIPNRPGYYDDFTVDFDSKPVVKCPLHDENTPSMRWYSDTDSFYCFGCRAGGDIVNLHKKFVYALQGREITLEEAVEELKQYFINYKTSTDIVGKRHKKSEASPVDTQRYLTAFARIENALLMDEATPLKTKIDAWKQLDTIDVIVRAGEMMPLEGKKLMEEIFNNIGGKVDASEASNCVPRCKMESVGNSGAAYSH